MQTVTPEPFRPPLPPLREVGVYSVQETTRLLPDAYSDASLLARLDLPVGTLKSRIRSGLKTLRTLLESH